MTNPYISDYIGNHDVIDINNDMLRKPLYNFGIDNHADQNTSHA